MSNSIGRAFVLSLLAAAACVSDPSNRVDGTVRGEPFAIRRAAWWLKDAQVVLRLSTEHDLCAERPARARIFELWIGDGPRGVGIGSYSISDSPREHDRYATTTLLAFDDAGEVDGKRSAGSTAGTVAVTEATELRVAGTFDATFDTGDHLEAYFAAAPLVCP